MELWVSVRILIQMRWLRRLVVEILLVDEPTSWLLEEIAKAQRVGLILIWKRSVFNQLQPLFSNKSKIIYIRTNTNKETRIHKDLIIKEDRLDLKLVAALADNGSKETQVLWTQKKEKENSDRVIP